MAEAVNFTGIEVFGIIVDFLLIWRTDPLVEWRFDLDGEGLGEF